jgi:hypothetical protein
VNLAAIGPDGAADGLAVRGRLLQQPRHDRFPGRRRSAALLALMPGRCRKALRRAGRQRRKVAAQRRVERLGPGTRAWPAAS